MLRLSLTVLLAILTGGGASAQTNSCMGNCMASDGPADNPNFHACLRRLCDADHVQPSEHIPTWNAGALKDGTIIWAGIDTQNGQHGLYYFCQDGGISDLMIPGVPKGVQKLAMTVDGHTFEKQFNSISGGVTAPIVPEDPLMRAMRGGKGVVIESLTGGNLMFAFPLIGAEEALEGAMIGCGFMQDDGRPLGPGLRSE